MRSRPIAAVAFLCLAVAPLGAELKYTLHLETRKAADVSAVDPIMALVGEQFTKMVPPGGADLVYTIGEQGIRVDFTQAAMGQPAGTVVVSRKDGEMRAFQPADKTYWKLAAPDLGTKLKEAGMVPRVAIKQTGELAEVVGMRTERVTFDWALDLPFTSEQKAGLPPGFPTSMSMSGDAWVSTDKRFEKYAAMVAGNKAVDFLSALGLDKMAFSGLILRSIVRFGGIEMHGEVTKVGEDTAPPGHFEVPEGFREIPQPDPVIR